MTLSFIEGAGGSVGAWAPGLFSPPVLSAGIVAPGAVVKVWYFLVAGGFFMGFIALCSLVAVSVVIHRALYLRKKNIVPDALENELLDVERRVSEGNTARLGQILAEDDSTLARISRIALSGEHATREEAIAATEARAREQLLKLQSGIAILEVVITIAPLLGLLGTVSGLVRVFGTLGGESAGALTDPAMVARGIAEALNTTIAGLAVAVPAVVAHSYFTRKIERFAVRMEVLMGMALAAFYRTGTFEEGAQPAAPPMDSLEAVPVEPADSQPVQL